MLWDDKMDLCRMPSGFHLHKISELSIERHLPKFSLYFHLFFNMKRDKNTKNIGELLLFQKNLMIVILLGTDTQGEGETLKKYFGGRREFTHY